MAAHGIAPQYFDICPYWTDWIMRVVLWGCVVRCTLPMREANSFNTCRSVDTILLCSTTLLKPYSSSSKQTLSRFWMFFHSMIKSSKVPPFLCSGEPLEQAHQQALTSVSAAANAPGPAGLLGLVMQGINQTQKGRSILLRILYQETWQCNTCSTMAHVDRCPAQ